MTLLRLYDYFIECGMVTTDSRHCPEGSMFFALKGSNFNGNAFAEAALEKGCRYAVVDEEQYVNGNPRIFLVKNVLETLQKLAKLHRHEIGIPIIGITGTNGKTTTKELIAAVNVARTGHDVYMIGNNASGKTSLINKALKGFENKTNRQIKTVKYPGTQVDVLEIPLSRSSFFYELPGISQDTSVVTKLEKDVVKQILPKKDIKVSVHNMAPGDALMVGSLAAFEVVKGKTTSYRFYAAEGVETRKVSSKRLDDAIKENNIRRSVRPVSERLVNFHDYDMFEYAMENDKKWHDIAIEGLGWLSFVALGQIIRIRLPKEVAIKESLAKIR